MKDVFVKLGTDFLSTIVFVALYLITGNVVLATCVAIAGAVIQLIYARIKGSQLGFMTYASRLRLGGADAGARRRHHRGGADRRHEAVGDLCVGGSDRGEGRGLCRTICRLSASRHQPDPRRAGLSERATSARPQHWAWAVRCAIPPPKAWPDPRTIPVLRRRMRGNADGGGRKLEHHHEHADGRP